MTTTVVATDTIDSVWAQRVADWVSSHTPTIGLDEPCDACDGTGTVTERRPRRLDELTDTQLSFLYTAQLEREQAKWGGEGGGGGAPAQQGMSQQMPGGGMQQRPPTDGPPMGGSAQKF